MKAVTSMPGYSKIFMQEFEVKKESKR